MTEPSNHTAFLAATLAVNGDDVQWSEIAIEFGTITGEGIDPTHFHAEDGDRRPNFLGCDLEKIINRHS